MTAYGPDYLGGVVYVGGSIVALHYHPECMHPTVVWLVPKVMSERADEMSEAAEGFVDSCVKAPLPYPTKLLWMGGFIAQPRTARWFSIRRVQDHTVWERTARPIPVLIIQGTEDVHCVHENMIGIAKRVYDDVEVRMVEGIGHSPHFESPEETNHSILKWAGAKRII